MVRCREGNSHITGYSVKRIHDEFHLTINTGKGIHNKLFFLYLFSSPVSSFQSRLESKYLYIHWFINECTLWPHMYIKYVSVCDQREITLNSGKEISAPQIIQGREFTTRDITSFTYQVMC